MKLVKDIYSNNKRILKPYGKKGEEVEVKHDHGNVVIVEKKDGELISVNVEDLC